MFKDIAHSHYGHIRWCLSVMYLYILEGDRLLSVQLDLFLNGLKRKKKKKILKNDQERLNENKLLNQSF